MAESLTISRYQQLSPAEDYGFLRKKGIEMIQLLCGTSWTDYNAHDPGITLLEAFCFAVTDLGYRASFDMKDILAANPRAAAGDKALEQLLYGPERILPSHPVTITDYRKLIADITGIRNVWVEKSDEYEVPIYVGQAPEGYTLTYEAGHGIALLPLKGLYRVRVEFEEDVIREKREEQVLDQVREKLHHHRNLCEDVVSIVPVEYEGFNLQAQIKVKEGCDIDVITAQVYQAIRNLFSPPINFYTPDQLKARGYTMEELFEGPVLKHGFIDSRELEEAALDEVQLSDVINKLSAIEGVIAIERLQIPSNAAGAFPDFDEWIKQLRERQQRPRLDSESSVVTFVRSGDRHRGMEERTPDAARVRSLLNYLLAGDQKVKLKTYERQWAPEAGEYMDLEAYYPFQRSLPACYRMEEKFAAQGVPYTADQQAVLRLRGFLFIFEQLLANYLSQLAHVRELFSIDTAVHQTYFTQLPTEIENWQALFVHLSQYEKQAAGLLETDENRMKRRNVLLDHLMARFGEELRERPGAGLAAGKDGAEKAIRDKAAFLAEAVTLSNYRGQGFDYSNPEEVWDTDNVAGCKKRICRLLGMPGYQRGSIASDALWVEEVRHENGVVRFVFRLVDPEDREVELLRSDEFEAREEAEEALEYLLEEGEDRHHYVFHRGHDRPAYHLQRMLEGNELDTIASRHFSRLEEMEKYFERLLGVLKGFSEKENFHLIEHILLRPRMDARVQGSGKRQPLIDKDRVALLPVPQDEADAVVPEQKELPEQAPYRFKVTQAGHEEWKLGLVDAAGKEVLELPEVFPFYSHVTRRMERLRRIAAEPNNLQIGVDDGDFRWYVYDEGRQVAHSHRRFKEEEKAIEEKEQVLRYFSFDWKSDEPTGVSDELAVFDPYSFRVTIVVPSWPARFRDPGFRHLIEKTIFLEVPAHICAQVYWVGHAALRRFEDAYRLWLTEQANEGIPNTEVLNNFLFELKKIRDASDQQGGV